MVIIFTRTSKKIRTAVSAGRIHNIGFITSNFILKYMAISLFELQEKFMIDIFDELEPFGENWINK